MYEAKFGENQLQGRGMLGSKNQSCLKWLETYFCFGIFEI